MHYYVWVLCTGPMPQYNADVECTLRSVLAPFNYEKAGPPREVQCGCSTMEGRLAEQLQNSIFGCVSLSQAVSSPIDEDLGRPWRGCTLCQGKGSYVDSSNPVGWLDGWARGGRWTGILNDCQLPTPSTGDEKHSAFFPVADEGGVNVPGKQGPLSDVVAADSVRDRVLSGDSDMQLPHAIVHPVGGAWLWSYAGGRPGHEDEEARSDWRESVWSALLQAQFVIVVDIHS